MASRDLFDLVGALLGDGALSDLAEKLPGGSSRVSRSSLTALLGRLGSSLDLTALTDLLDGDGRDRGSTSVAAAVLAALSSMLGGERDAKETDSISVEDLAALLSKNSGSSGSVDLSGLLGALGEEKPARRKTTGKTAGVDLSDGLDLSDAVGLAGALLENAGSGKRKSSRKKKSSKSSGGVDLSDGLDLSDVLGLLK